MDNESKSVVINTAISKVDTSRTIWIVVAAIQLVIGVLTICELYGMLPIILGVINLIKANELKNKIEEYKRNPRDMVSHYEPILMNLCIFLILNFVFGAVIGCIGILYEMNLRSYIVKHKIELR